MRGGYLDAIARKTGRRKFSYLCPRQNTIPMRYFLELRYNGAAYCGWQRQPDQPSVQQTLERALSTLLREQLEVTGAGRTDTGVNASYYVAHCDVSQPVADPGRTVYKLNFLLPGDIKKHKTGERCSPVL